MSDPVSMAIISFISGAALSLLIAVPVVRRAHARQTDRLNGEINDLTEELRIAGINIERTRRTIPDREDETVRLAQITREIAGRDAVIRSLQERVEQFERRFETLRNVFEGTSDSPTVQKRIGGTREVPLSRSLDLASSHTGTPQALFATFGATPTPGAATRGPKQQSVANPLVLSEAPKNPVDFTGSSPANRMPAAALDAPPLTNVEFPKAFATLATPDPSPVAFEARADLFDAVAQATSRIMSGDGIAAGDQPVDGTDTRNRDEIVPDRAGRPMPEERTRTTTKSPIAEVESLLKQLQDLSPEGHA